MSLISELVDIYFPPTCCIRLQEAKKHMPSEASETIKILHRMSVVIAKQTTNVSFL